MALTPPMPQATVEEPVVAPAPANRRLERDRGVLARRWLALAVLALAGSGALAFGVVLARVPFVARHLTATDLARRVLVVHVGLGVLVWFSAVPVMLFHLRGLVAGSRRAGRAAVLAPWMSAAGAVLLASGLLPGIGTVHTVNYVPLIAQPWYVAGLLLFFAGVLLSYLDAGALRVVRRDAAAAFSVEPALPDVVVRTIAGTGGLVVLGAAYVLLSAIALAGAFVRLPQGLDPDTWLELLMWGPGHVFQLSNVAFVLVAWALLAAWGSGRRLGRRLGWVVLALAVPLLPVLALVAQGPNWWFSRSGFVLLMQWGLFPSVLLFLALVLAPHFLARATGRRPASRAALWPLAASVALMLVGFAFGALIRGSDLRIPGHYHACIGAVTLAYMALTLLLLARSDDASRALRAVAVLYGTGQLVFSSGLVLAGTYGLGRKIYGVEQHVGGVGQQAGLALMAVGGLLALSGGAVWAVAALRRLRAA